MMAKGKSTALAGIFDDEPADLPAAPPAAAPAREAEPEPQPAPAVTKARQPRAQASAEKPAAKGNSRNHGTKKPVLIHIPEDMHRMLRRISVEEGEPLSAITERMLRQYLVTKGHTKFAPAKTA